MRPAAAIDAAGHFDLGGPAVDAEWLPRGHIHESWRVATARGRFLVQRLNTRVFPDPDALAANLRVVLDHVGGPVTVVPSLDGGPLWRDAGGGVWRAVAWIEGAEPAGPGQALTVAAAFGAFDRRLAEIPAGRLHEVIPHFHDPARRFARLEAVASADPVGRLTAVAALLEEVRALSWLADVLPPLPRRVAHHDAKADNVLVDREGRVVAIVDLDTVMPGSPVWDVGDLVRSLAGPAREDDAGGGADPAKARAIVDAFLAGCGDLLDTAERHALDWAGPVVTWETAVRFLTDHLEGDPYFRIERPGQNAERALAQVRLVEDLVAERARP